MCAWDAQQPAHSASQAHKHKHHKHINNLLLSLIEWSPSSKSIQDIMDFITRRDCKIPLLTRNSLASASVILYDTILTTRSTVHITRWPKCLFCVELSHDLLQKWEVMLLCQKVQQDNIWCQYFHCWIPLVNHMSQVHLFMYCVGGQRQMSVLELDMHSILNKHNSTQTWWIRMSEQTCLWVRVKHVDILSTLERFKKRPSPFYFTLIFYWEQQDLNRTGVFVFKTKLQTSTALAWATPPDFELLYTQLFTWHIVQLITFQLQDLCVDVRGVFKT